jgi:serine phosphatase RsbU (regulator of sigma subunit)
MRPDSVAAAFTLQLCRFGAPYLTGAELEIENGLPLGLSEESIYAESACQLKADEQLTLMTDGVVEARDCTGELFGFERVANIASSAAEAIARAA